MSEMHKSLNEKYDPELSLHTSTKIKANLELENTQKDILD
jgi:hypothetical protein